MGNSRGIPPSELIAVADRRGLDGDNLVRTSRLTAKIDNNCIADGFQVYLHSFVVAANGEWAVIQQGMNEQSGMARRYHWHSSAVRDFVSEPHKGIVGEAQGVILNLVDEKAVAARQALLTIAGDTPGKDTSGSSTSRATPASRRSARGRGPEETWVRVGSGVRARPEEFRGPSACRESRTENVTNSCACCRGYSWSSESIPGSRSLFLRIGGKDRHPFPVPLKIFDESIAVLRNSLDIAPVDGGHKIEGFRRLDRFRARRGGKTTTRSRPGSGHGSRAGDICIARWAERF